MVVAPNVPTFEQPGERRIFETEMRQGICVVRFVEPIIRDEDRLNDLKQTFLQLAIDHRRFVINLTVVEYFSSVALGSLVQMRRTVAKVDGRIHLCGVTDAIAELFSVSSLHDLFAWFKTEDEAIADLLS